MRDLRNFEVSPCPISVAVLDKEHTYADSGHADLSHDAREATFSFPTFEPWTWARATVARRRAVITATRRTGVTLRSFLEWQE